MLAPYTMEVLNDDVFLTLDAEQIYPNEMPQIGDN